MDSWIETLSILTLIYIYLCSVPLSTDSFLDIKVKRGGKARTAVGHCSFQPLRFTWLKYVPRGYHIWPRIRRRETFIAPATSFSLFLSLLWAIQDPKQQTKQCCTFRRRVFILFKESMRCTDRLLLLNRHFSITIDYCSWFLLYPLTNSGENVNDFVSN